MMRSGMGRNKKRSARGGHGRIKTAGDALDQLTSIEHAQVERRRKRTKQIVDDITKSKQRLMNFLNTIKDPDDAAEDLD